MNENNLDNIISDEEFTLESILAEYKAEAYIAGEKRTPPSELEQRSRSIVMEALSDTISAAQLRDQDLDAPPQDSASPDAAAAPEASAPQEDAATPAPEAPPAATSAPEPDLASEPEPAPEPRRAPAPEARELYGRAQERDTYARADFPAPEEDEAEDEEDTGSKPRLNLSEVFLAPLVSILAIVAARRQQRKAAEKTEEEYQETQAPEVPPKKAFRLYASQVGPLKLRGMLALFLCAITIYISFAHSLGLPLLGAMQSVRVSAIMCLILLATVMLVGLDIFTTGFLSLLRGRPGPESLVAVTCLASVADAIAVAVAGEGAPGLPFCGAAALSMLCALWGSRLTCTALRTGFQILSMAKNPYAVTVETGVDDEEDALLKSARPITGFIRRSEGADFTESAYRFLAPFLLIAALVLSALVAISGRGNFFHVLAAMTAVAAPLSMSVAFPLPFAIAARRLARSGAALAGCAGCADIGKSRRIVITDTDLFPAGTISIEGIRILEGTFTDKVISYTGSMLACSGGGLSPVFTELMRRNGCTMHRVENFSVHEGGGLTGLIRGEQVLVGTNGFMQLMGIRLPHSLNTKNAVFTAFNGSLVGIFNMSYVPVSSVQDALVSLLHGKHFPLFAIRDFNITPLLIRQKFKMPTDGFDFPSMAERYRLSALAPDEESPVAAVISREGLGPMVETAECGRKLCFAARVGLILSILASVLGLLVLFFLCWSSAYDSATVSNLLSFMLLWLIPVLVISYGVGR